ncbi:MAG TPA: Rid family detoxifying hydrolase [Noviherbaspirillum sp.]|nr:Rid family detoxifying hydrolase [Noviherbaspirillum sp.]
MQKTQIHTDKAPKAIGTYSQAIRAGQTVYLSAQAPLVPETMDVAPGGIEAEIEQVFDNLSAVATAAGGNLDNIVKLTVYLTDLTHFPLVNRIMERRFNAPYPARAAVGATALPRSTNVAVEAIMVLPG